MLIDARAAGIRYPISGMWGGANDDLDGLRAWLKELRDIGYFGMMMGNAEHVPIVNEAFTPTAAEIAYWQELDRLTIEAEAAGDARAARRRQPGRGTRGAHRARRDGAQAARVGARARSRGMSRASRASEIRAGLSHPIVDADGHFVELGPLLNDEMLTYLEEMGGRELRDRVRAAQRRDRHVDRPRRAPRARPDRAGRPCRRGGAGRPQNTLDRATAHLPALLYERLDEFGIDFTILYPSMTLSYLEIHDDDLAALRCRAANRYLARPVRRAGRPLHRRRAGPDDSTRRWRVAELEYAVRELGFKTAVFAGHARRPVGDPGGLAYRLDTFGVDSAYDYDPLWAKCVELGVAPVFHSSLQSHRVTRSATSYVYNHVGGLAANHESLCKSLFLSGVTHRFPDAPFGFLEGGVAWACALFSDLVGHWEKRNADVDRHARPRPARRRRADGAVRSVRRRPRARVDRPSCATTSPGPRPVPRSSTSSLRPALRSVADLRDRFVPNFYFGCEADDRLVAWAFAEQVNPAGARFRPIFGSDISHWDVPDMTEPVVEAFELVDDGVIGAREFEELMFVNPVRMHGEMNPSFFDGTIVEAQATNILRS